MEGGFVRDFPIGFCRSLLGDDCYVLEKLGEKFSFDLNIGYNGKVWIRGAFADTIFIMNVLERAVETNNNKQRIDMILAVLDQQSKKKTIKK